MLKAIGIAVSMAILMALLPSICFADTDVCPVSEAKTIGCKVPADLPPVPLPTAKADDLGVDLSANLNLPGSGRSNPERGSNGKAVTHPGNAPLPYLGRDGYTVTAPVRLSDIVRFRPEAGIDRMQPDGWMIVGLPTNFYARAVQHTKSGTLLGQPASVRFTPARYSWSYGDGATRTTSTPGGSWSRLGINEFDATQTSHVYSAPGTYVIDLTIGYTPEYRYANGTDWIPITGIVWSSANRLEAAASAGAKTVLVEDECTVNPEGPGC